MSMIIDQIDSDMVMGDAMDDTRDDREREAPEPKTRPLLIVKVDDDHPFDLESYISQYTGRIAIQNLQHIAVHCRELVPSASQHAIKLFKSQTRDPGGYVKAVNDYNASYHSGANISVDHTWVDQMDMKNLKEKNRLEAELKTYTSNMIKESIRMAHRDLAAFYHETGNLAESLKHYAKCREFCTSNQHLLDMCLLILEILIEQRNYAHISTYVYKAESALEHAPPVTTTTSAAAPTSRRAPVAAAPGPSGTSTATGAQDASREKTQAKLDIASALSYLGQGNYEKAARSFLKVPSVKALDDWSNKLISPSDIAIFAVLCALATFPRSAIKAAILESETFATFIEQESYIREMLDAYMRSNFKDVLQILERHSTRHALSTHLSQHLPALTAQIRSRALVLYFTPFHAVRLETMSAAFGIEVSRLENEIVALIKEDRIKARLDGKNKILKSRDAEQDERAEMYKKVLKAGRDMQAGNRKLLLRMSLIQNELVVKAPKHSEKNKELLIGSSAPMEIYD